MDKPQPIVMTDGSTEASNSESNPPGPGDTAECTVGISAPFQSMTGQSPLLDQCLQFLSSANSVTLSASAGVVLLVAYIFLGRLSLVLCGVFAGVVLHASWDSLKEAGDASLKSDLSLRRRELGIEVANRLLSWDQTRNADTPSEETISGDISTNELDYSDFQPATAAALNTLTDAIIQDYVRWWYGPILPSETSFPQSCRSSLTRFIVSMSTHLSKKRPAEVFLHFVTNASSIVVVFLNELSAALESASAAPTSTGDAVSSYLHNYPDSNLANVLSKNQQHAKLRLVATDILQTFLEPALFKCEPAKVFLREVFSGVILESIIENCSKPEWINGWIVRLLEEGEPELMNAIDIGVDRARQDQMKEFAASSPTQNNETPEYTSGGRVAVGEPSKSQGNKGLTKAEIEMEEAVREAKRLSAMIAVDNSRRSSERTATIESGGDSDIRINYSPSPSETYPEMTAYSSNDNRTSNNVLTKPETSRSSNEPDDVRKSTNEPRWKREVSVQTVLLGASVSIVDDAFPNDKGKLRVKPTDDYLLQIEPLGSRYSGWVITRKYSDFEGLHEVLRRISVVSGVSDFVEQHKELPTWKGQYRSDLRQSLERYLRHALCFECLAGCEAMKRFLEKERGAPASWLNGTGKSGFSFPSQAVFENMGKGVLGVLSNAPKGVAGGGKAVFEGVTGVFGANGGIGKRSTELIPEDKIDTKGERSSGDFFSGPRTGEGVARSEPTRFPSRTSTENYFPSDSPSFSEIDSGTPSTHTTHNHSDNRSPHRTYGGEHPVFGENTGEETHCTTGEDRNQELLSQQVFSAEEDTADMSESNVKHEKPRLGRVSREATVLSLSEEETSVAVELLFAVINELYALSSAWGIRKKLLNAAKTFLLRPGNPNIEAIRLLAQDSIIESNASDDALAAHINVLRQNALPTEDELKSWPPPLTNEERNELRIKARKLLVTRGMPQALTSIMGNAATAEALGHVFDSLQVESVARGFIFALLLQALKAVIQ
ncbi:hypothetical protein AJ79_09017 [Helicocarpus griseus UAMH5409]|uniref:PXA domain-containing protein n=1 Tax=Helicocarpus griseus UAMH5409 TaxID=1447875 RepID=A0A2B7WMW7_9EURO|nr:hypothetical protein AJ79_09017 [Helicocarpus griseus UAMH5409]